MSKKLLIPDEAIVSKIYLIRGQKVMIDRDLAELYGIEARRLREQVKRNMERFPENFMFQLSEEETEYMVSQNATPSRQYLGGHLPYVFTEHGVLMLASVLKSERAVQMSINIIEIFVRLREMLLTNKDILLKLEQLESKVAHHDENIQMIFSALKQLLNTPQTSRKRIGFRPNDD
jgi:phage regulator Rha-like protein